MSAVDRMARAARPGKTIIPATRGVRFLAVKHTRSGVWLEIDTGNKTASITVPWSALRDAVEGAPSGLGLADVEGELAMPGRWTA